MRKLFVAVLCMMSVSAVTAQKIKIKKSFLLSEQKGYYPKLSEDGSFVAFSSESYSGLSIYNFSTGAVQEVSREEGAGYDPVFSENNERIYYRNILYESNLRKEGLKSFDLSDGKQEVIFKPVRNLKHPKSLSKGVVALAGDELLKSAGIQYDSPVDNYVWSDGVNLYIFRNNKTEILNPVDGANGYVWATVSPDQKMILFTAAAKGTFVCNLNGEIVADLGFLNAPAWYGNDYVVGMQDRDDGSFVTESKIVMKNLKGTVEKVLSTPEQIAMYPTASEKAAKISYNTTAGDIWVVELKVKERGFFSRLFGR